eukprot:gene1526-1782_t
MRSKSTPPQLVITTASHRGLSKHPASSSYDESIQNNPESMISDEGDMLSSADEESTSVGSSTNELPTLPSSNELGVILKSLKLIEKNRYSSTIKCAILGANYVGKTSFMRRFSSGEFDPEETTTIGAIRTLHTIHYSSLSLNLEIWDTGGHDRLKGLLPFYLKNVSCIIIMFDLSSTDSYYKALDTLTKAKKMVAEGSIFLLVANKSDIREKVVTTAQISKACQDSEIGHVSWCEISARTGYNIHEPFHMISQHITTMINALRTNQRIEKMHTRLASDGTKPAFFGFCEFEGNEEVDSSLPITSPDLAMIKSNMYTCTERVFRTADPLLVVLKLDVLKIIIESTGGLINKLLSKRTFIFKEVNDQTPSTDSGGDFQLNGEFKGSFCLVVDKYHPKRIEVRRFSSSNTSNTPNNKYEIVLLCDYRDHLIRSFKSLCSVSIPINEGSKSIDRGDFLYTYKESLRLFNKEVNPNIEFQILNPPNTPFNKLDLSKILTDDKHLLSISKAIEWNASLTKLDLSYNSFDIFDAKTVSELFNAISSSVSILHLDLTGNNLGSKHKSLLVDLIKPSLKLKTLILNSNDLCSTTNLISQSLSSNTNLTTLGLANNNIKNVHAQALSQMLQINHALETLDLSNNAIEEEGALFLLNSIEKSTSSKHHNTTLSKIHLTGNKSISTNTLNLIHSVLTK